MIPVVLLACAGDADGNGTVDMTVTYTYDCQ